MDELTHELVGSFTNKQELVRGTTRLIAAMIVGALIGYQREKVGKAAGLRTHILVAMGTSLFVIASVNLENDGLSRVIQGLATGIGFLGAGAILKIKENQEILGLTTAAGIWMTAAASVTIGLGQIGLGLIAGIFAWLVLGVFHKFEPQAVDDSPGNP